MLMKSLSLAAVIGLFFGFAAPAAAQNSNAVNSAKIEVLERQIRMLRARLGMNPAAPEEGAGGTSSANPQLIANLSAKIGTLESQIRKLNGRLEEIEYRQRQTAEEIELLRKELDLQRQEFARGATAVQPSSATEGAISQPDMLPAADGGQALSPVVGAEAEAEAVTVTLPEGDAAAQFDFAFAYVRKNDLTRGQLAFEQFIEANAGDSRIGNAKYWLGRIHLQEGRNAKAAQYLLALIEEHPNHAKRSDALVDLADVLLKLDSADDACNALAEFRRVEEKASARLKARAGRVAAAARCG